MIALGSKKKCIIFGILISNFLFHLSAMEKNPSLILYLMRDAIGRNQVFLGTTFLQQSLETTKAISTKLIASCYNHPKLFFSATTMTLVLIALKRSTLWPITKHDLKKFKQESIEKAQEQLKQFIAHNDEATQESTRLLAATIDVSQNQLLLLHDELTDSKHALEQAPLKLEKSLTLLESQENTNQNALFSQASLHNTTQLNTIEACVDKLMHKDEMAISHHLEQFSNQSTSLENSLDLTIQAIMLALAQETATLYEITHSSNHQETLQLSKIHQSMDNHHDHLAGRMDSIILTLEGLIDTESEKPSHEKSLDSKEIKN